MTIIHTCDNIMTLNIKSAFAFTVANQLSIDWLGFYVPHDMKTGHFRDVLPSQSLGLVLEKNEKANMHL